MANHALFVRYLAHPPIKIQTHFDDRGEPRKSPLTSVADVLAAAAADAARRRLGVPPDPPLRPDSPVAGLAATSKNPLAITCGIRPDVKTRIWKSVVHISCDKFSGTGIIIDKADGDLYILTNLHLLGTDNAVLSHVKQEVARYKKIHHGTAHLVTRSKVDRESSSDSIKITIQQYTGSSVLEFVLEFVLDDSTCWAASGSFDFMIFRVPASADCTLEKSVLSVADYRPNLPVHIFGFPGILGVDKEFEHNYCAITAEIMGKDIMGHVILSALSTPGLSGSGIVCTSRGFPIGYLCGGFNISGNEHFQCYGYGFEFVPKHLPRFLPRVL